MSDFTSSPGPPSPALSLRSIAASDASGRSIMSAMSLPIAPHRRLATKPVGSAAGGQPHANAGSDFSKVKSWQDQAAPSPRKRDAALTPRSKRIKKFLSLFPGEAAGSARAGSSLHASLETSLEQAEDEAGVAIEQQQDALDYMVRRYPRLC